MDTPHDQGGKLAQGFPHDGGAHRDDHPGVDPGVVRQPQAHAQEVAGQIGPIDIQPSTTFEHEIRAESVPQKVTEDHTLRPQDAPEVRSSSVQAASNQPDPHASYKPMELGQQIGPNGEPIVASIPDPGALPKPSGRWQTFWYAISVLTLGIMFICTSTVTSNGTLQKLLLGLQANPDDILFGERLSIILGNSLLSAFVVCLPLFLIATIKVDSYKSSHPDVPTQAMKKISYIFMVLTILALIGQIGSAIFEALNYSFSAINVVPVIVDIAFACIYFFWLYTTVAEDRLV